MWGTIGSVEVSGRVLIDQRYRDLVSEREPSRRQLSGKNLQPRPRRRAFDHFAYRIGFLAMRATRCLNPTTQAEVIEAVVLATHGGQHDLVRHTPVVTSTKLRFTPDKLRYDPEPPVLRD